MDVEECELEIDRVEELADGAEMAIEVLRGQLKPYWDAKGDIEHSIRRTHNRRSDGAIRFRLEGAATRTPLFAALDSLNAEWRESKQDWAAMKSRLAGYERELKKLKTELKYLKRKEDKSEQNKRGQGQLL